MLKSCKRCVDVLVDCIISLGVKHVFTLPGGAECQINDALCKAEKKGLLSTKLSRHELGAGHMADGYARTTGRPGVVIVTSGPGATNLVTAACTALQDSIPLICITGNVPTYLEGTLAFQECDILSVVRPIVKECIAIRRPQDIIPLMDRAFKIAMEGKRGVVWIDIPKDVQNGIVYTMENAIEDLQSSRRPLIIAGHGVLLSGLKSVDLLRLLSKKLHIPVAVTMHGISSMETQDPLYLGMVGMHGTYQANSATHQSDLILAIGCRLDDRVTLNLKDKFAPHAKIIRVDLTLGVNPIYDRCKFLYSDAGDFIQKILESSIQQKDTWIYPLEHDIPLPAKMLQKMDEIYYDPHRIVVSDVGQNLIWATLGFRFSDPDTHITSGGAGTMGFALPAAIGILIAKGPKLLVVMVAGDGGFDMTKSELATMKDNNLPIKMIIINNGGLGMVRLALTEYFEGRHFAVDLETKYGEWTIIEGTAKTYNIPYFGCKTLEDIAHAWESAIGDNRLNPVLIELFISKDEICRPQIRQNASSLIDMSL